MTWAIWYGSNSPRGSNVALDVIVLGLPIAPMSENTYPLGFGDLHVPRARTIHTVTGNTAR